MDERPIHKLTQEPVSEEFIHVLDRLRHGEEVPISEIEKLPEIKFADACHSNSKPKRHGRGRKFIKLKTRGRNPRRRKNARETLTRRKNLDKL